MAKFSITIDASVAKGIESEATEGESAANTIERLVVTAIGRLASSRKYARAHAKALKAKKAKAPKQAKPSAAKAKPAKKAKAPKAPAAPVEGLPASDLTAL